MYAICIIQNKTFAISQDSHTTHKMKSISKTPHSQPHINPRTGEISLGKAIICPGSRLTDFPQLQGKRLMDFLSVSLPWQFMEMPWFANLHETKKLFGAQIDKVTLSACPYPEGITIEEATREEEIAFVQQEFLKGQLGEPHEKGAVATHYRKNPIYVHYAYKYPWGAVASCWDPKNMMSQAIEVVYASP